MYPVLEGLRIIEGSAFVAAPMGGLTLAQLGADVIRFDPIGGGVDAKRWPLTEAGDSIYWASLNKSKRSIAINVRDPEGQALVADLITRPGEGGGFFLTNLPPRGALTFDALRERREDVVMVQVTGHADGTTALDYTVNCAVGYPVVTGNARDDAPINHTFPAWDVITGLTAATGILAAERRRRSTGTGELIRLALSDIAYATVGHLGHIAEAMVNGTQREPIGNHLYGAFGRDLPTRDGRRVMVTAITVRQWRSLCEATGTTESMKHLERMLDVDLDDEGERFHARDFIATLLERWTRTKTFAEVGEAFDAAGVCWGPYQSFLQMVDEDPRCSTANPMFQTVTQPGMGELLVPGSALNFTSTERVPVRPAPRLGEHTDEILSEVLGLGDARIGELHDRGVVAGPD